MSTEDNKAIVHRFYDEVIHKKNMAAGEELLDPNFVDHSLPPGMPGGIEGVRQLYRMYFTAFPDLVMTVEDMMAEGDQVVARLTVNATQQGAFMGIPPTGKHVTFTAIDINRISNGKMAEHWSNFDNLGMMQQLGMISSMEKAKE